MMTHDISDQDASDAALEYVDHEPQSWFLLRHGESLYLDARYSYSAIIDDSALILLSEREAESYHGGGHDYISDLARRIHNSAPYTSESHFYERNLYRGADARQWRNAVHAAIAQHTWAATQGRSGR